MTEDEERYVNNLLEKNPPTVVDETIKTAPSQPASMEAPMSVTIQAYYKGFSVLITKRDAQVSVSPLITQSMQAIDKMIDLKFKPSWNDETNQTALGRTVGEAVGYKPPKTPAQSIPSKKAVCPSCGGDAEEKEWYSFKNKKKLHAIFCKVDKDHVKWMNPW